MIYLVSWLRFFVAMAIANTFSGHSSLLKIVLPATGSCCPAFLG
jgi:hypothetical protein